MPRKHALEEALAALEALARAPLCDETVTALRKALLGPGHILAAKAAALAGRRGIEALLPDLADAFERFMVDPGKTDKGCLAKTAIAGALDALGHRDSALFVRGIRHTQLEPAYGGPVDSAVELRAACALALVRGGYEDVHFELVQLLADPQPRARQAAVNALAWLEGEASELLLRMKALAGDSDQAVLGDCFAALMKLNPERSLGFVAGFLRSETFKTAQDAALALGGSRHPRACGLLLERRAATFDRDLKRMLVLPVALTRCDEAFEFLLDVLANEPRENAAEAVEALAMFDEAGRAERIRACLARRGDEDLTELLGSRHARRQ